jgi:hypothetical protein
MQGAPMFATIAFYMNGFLDKPKEDSGRETGVFLPTKVSLCPSPRDMRHAWYMRHTYTVEHTHVAMAITPMLYSLASVYGQSRQEGHDLSVPAY